MRERKKEIDFELCQTLKRLVISLEFEEDSLMGLNDRKRAYQLLYYFCLFTNEGNFRLA